MEPLTGILVLMFGSIIGSFLNVCIHRIPKNESIVFPMSHCPNCSRNIFWYDNIPMLSYIVLRGQCRFCGTKISFRYFAVEFLTTLGLFLLFLAFGITPKFFAYAILYCGLVVSTFVDFAIQEIPDQVSVGGMILGLITAIIFPSVFDTASRSASILNSFLGVITGGGSIYAMGVLGKFAFRKEAMGGGDVKLMAMIGSFLGWKLVLVIFFVAPVFGAVVGIILKMKDGRETIPYGPYLSLGALVAIFFGNKIIEMFFGGLF